jgi:hypothetical protein
VVCGPPLVVVFDGHLVPPPLVVRPSHPCRVMRQEHIAVIAVVLHRSPCVVCAVLVSCCARVA